MTTQAEATADMAGKRDARLRMAEYCLLSACKHIQEQLDLDDDQFEQIRRGWTVINGEHPGLNPGRQAKLIVGYLNATDGFLEQRGLWRELLTWSKLGLQTVFTSGNRALVGGILNDIAPVSGYLKAVLAIRTTNTDPAEAGATLRNLSALPSAEKDTISAVAFYEQSLALRWVIEDANGLARTLPNLALMRYELGQIANAEELLMEVVEMDQRFEFIHLDRDRKTLADVCRQLRRLGLNDKEVKQESTHV